MDILTGMFIVLAVSGWGTAVWQWRAASSARQATAAVTALGTVSQGLLLDLKGKPESLRRVVGNPPNVYRRPHGKGPATVYDRVGLAALYRPRGS